MREWEKFFFLVCLRMRAKPKAEMNDIQYTFGNSWRLRLRKEWLVCSLPDEEINENVAIEVVQLMLFTRFAHTKN